MQLLIIKIKKLEQKPKRLPRVKRLTIKIRNDKTGIKNEINKDNV